jgi:phosphatidylglycerol---prolipoprotein diacylglyceryl transferase
MPVAEVFLRRGGSSVPRSVWSMSTCGGIRPVHCPGTKDVWPFINGFYSYWYIYPLSVPAHAAWAYFLRRRFGAPLRVRLVVVVCYFIGMFPGAKALFDITNHNFHPLKLLSIEHFLAGGMWGGPLVVLVLLLVSLRICAKTEWSRWLDYAAMSLPVPMAVSKVACLAQGCCYGRPTSMPWGLHFPAGGPVAPSTSALHPTQVYEILWCLGVLIALLRVDSTSRWRGTLLLWFVALYCAGRTGIELLYGADRISVAGLSVSQLVCAFAFICCILILFIWRRRTLRSLSAPRIEAQRHGQVQRPKEEHSAPR